MDKKSTSKIFISFIAAVFVLSGIIAGSAVLTPQTAYGASADLLRGFKPGDTAVYKNSGYLRGSDGKYYTGQVNDSRRYAYGIFDKKADLVRRLYCVDRLKLNPSSGSDKYTARGPSALNDLPEGRRNGIMIALLYGRQLGYDTGKLKEVLGISQGNGDDWWIATQSIIWEFAGGYRSSPASIPKNVSSGNLGTKAAEGKNKNFMYNYVKGRPAEKIYFAMLKKIRAHREIPSFTAGQERKANSKIIYMEKCEDGIWRSVNPKYKGTMTEAERAEARSGQDYHLLTDKNDIGAELFVPNSSDEVNSNYEFIKKGDNQYILEYKGNALPDEARRVKKKNAVETSKDTLLVWTKSGYQPLVMGAYDSIESFFKMKETGESVPETPPSERGVPREPQLPSFELAVEKVDKNPGWDAVSGYSHTPMGGAGLDSVITLYLNGQEYDRAFLDFYGYQEEPFSFMPWSSLEELDLREEPYSVADENGSEIEYTRYIYTGSCEVTTAESSLPAGRLTEQASDTGSGSRNHGTVSYRAVCTDQPGREDPEYSLTYRDDDGHSVTITDPDMISPDSPLTLFGATGDNAYVNDNYRGILQIIKTKNDRDPFTSGDRDQGVKEYSAKSLWTIQLADGGYEDCPYVKVVEVPPQGQGYDQFAKTYRATKSSTGFCADESAPLTMSDHGQIKILDLPYGTYRVSEISADDPGYVLETFYVTVSANNQLLSREVNNRVVTNKLKIVKTNSETGKAVRWDGERTAFRIRYKGNPDLADPTSSPNYNRLLPNGSEYADKNRNYVFYADKNGEIILPYEIEYGIYELEELTVPEGYYVGKYDENGIGSAASMGSLEIRNHLGQSVDPPLSFIDTVQIYDEHGKPVENFTGDSLTYNSYRFTVTEQDAHVDGEDYITYHAAVEIPNNPAKGIIRLSKTGETLIRWDKKKQGNSDIFLPVWEPVALSGAEFEIYAADDIMQNDGTPSVVPFHTQSRLPVDFNLVSREHSSSDNPLEIKEAQLPGGNMIRRTEERTPSADNTDITEYIAQPAAGARYTENFSVKDKDAGLTFKYRVEYTMNYTPGGFSYTDVYIKKKTVADDYVPSIKTSEPVLVSGEETLDFVTMNYDGGNMVRMLPLTSRDGESSASPESQTEGVKKAYEDNDIRVTVVKPADLSDSDSGNTETAGSGESSEDSAADIPDNWTLVNNPRTDRPYDDKYLITCNGEYKILVKDGNRKRWISCDEEGVFHISYVQEYAFSLAQHSDSRHGFRLTWDNQTELVTATDENGRFGIATVYGPTGGSPEIYTSPSYSFEQKTDGNRSATVFTGSSRSEAPVYFETRDGIRTQMSFSGGLIYTTVTVPQDSLKTFDMVYPVINYGSGQNVQPGEVTDDTVCEWSKDLTPDNPDFEKIYDAENYVKAVRREVSGDNPKACYTIDIVSSHSSSRDGFTITYPDGTMCTPLIENDDKSAVLRFESPAHTLVYPKGQPVEAIKSGEDGIASSKPLPLGEYWVREISSAKGHVNRGLWKKFTLEYKDQYTPLVWAAEQYENQAVPLRLRLEKLFETGYGSGVYEQGSGAVFGLFTGEAREKESLPPDSLVATGTVADGILEIEAKLPKGKYYIRELSPPKGYEISTHRYYFNAEDVLSSGSLELSVPSEGASGFINHTGGNGALLDMDFLYRYPASSVSVNGKTYHTDRPASDENVTVNVLDGRTNFNIAIPENETSIVRFDDDSFIEIRCTKTGYTAHLNGAGIKLAGKDSLESRGFKLQERENATSVEYAPNISFTGIHSDITYSYDILSSEDPAAEARYHSLRISSPSGNEAVTAVPDPLSGNLIVNLTDAGSSDATGTKQTLTPERGKVSLAFDDGSFVDIALESSHNADSNKRTVHIISSFLAEGEADVKKLLTVNDREELPPEVAVENVITNTYVRNSTNSDLLNIRTGTVKNNRKPDSPPTPVYPSPNPTPTGSFTLYKADSSTGDALSGAVFEVADESGKIVCRSTTDNHGGFTVSKLPYGTYTYREVTAPAGYNLDDSPYTFTVSPENSVVEVIAENTPTPQEPEPTVNEPEKPEDPENKTRVKSWKPGDSPKTGDNAAALLYMLLFTAASILLIYLTISRPNRP